MTKEPNVFPVRAKLASGERVTYYYAWRGGPRLPGLPGSPEYLRALADHRERRKGKRTEFSDTFAGLVAAYKNSGDYRKLGDASKRAYERYFNGLVDEFGSMPMALLDDKRVRRDFIKYRDTFAKNPRTADYVMQSLKRVLSWGSTAGYLDTNQAEPIPRLHSVDRSDSILEPEEYERLAAKASKEVLWAIDLALLSGMRQGDLIRFPWTRYDGTAFDPNTSKRNKWALIPATKPARALMERIERRGVVVLTSSRGLPWTENGLRASYNTLRTLPDVKVKRTWHDLRRTAATNLMIAGLSDGQIALIMGWEEKSVTHLRTKYVSKRKVVESLLAMIERRGYENASETENAK